MPKVAVSSDFIVVVIDLMEFRRALLVRFLSEWSLAEKVGLLSFAPTNSHGALREDLNCRMIIFNAGSASCSSAETLAEITVLRALAPSARVVVLADEEVPEDVIAVMQSGAEGYLSNRSTPELVLGALSFILRGGTYVPRSAVAHATFASERSPKVDHEAHGAIVHDLDADSPGDHAPLAMVASPPPSAPPELSERQKAILEGLCRGEPNKLIGRALNLPESTVKVHVREIMRKFAVSNRTQVAVVASRMGASFGDKQASRGSRLLPVVQSPGGPPNLVPTMPPATGADLASNVRPLSFRNLVQNKMPNAS